MYADSFLPVFPLARGLDAAVSLLNPHHARIALIYLHKSFFVVVSGQGYLCARSLAGFSIVCKQKHTNGV